MRMYQFLEWVLDKQPENLHSKEQCVEAGKSVACMWSGRRYSCHCHWSKHKGRGLQKSANRLNQI